MLADKYKNQNKQYHQKCKFQAKQYSSVVTQFYQSLVYKNELNVSNYSGSN